MHKFPHMSNPPCDPQILWDIESYHHPRNHQAFSHQPLKHSFSLCIFFLFLKKYLCIYFTFWLWRVFVAVFELSLIAVTRGYSLVVVSGLLMAVASFIAEQGLQGAWNSVGAAGGFGIWGSWALGFWLCSLAHGLSCSAACGLFPDQGSNRCPLHCKVTRSEKCNQGIPLFLHFQRSFCLPLEEGSVGGWRAGEEKAGSPMQLRSRQVMLMTGSRVGTNEKRKKWIYLECINTWR